MSETEVMVGDERGRLTYLQKIDDAEKISMKIVETKYNRFKSVVTSPDRAFFAALTSQTLTLWEIERFRKELAEAEGEDAIVKLDAHKEIESSARLLCCAVTVI